MDIDRLRERQRLERERQRRETFKHTLRLEAADLQRQWHQPIKSLRVALKRHQAVAGSIEVNQINDDHLKLSWPVDNGTATESQVLTVHSGAVLSLRCPECKEFRRRLFFTIHDNCPFDTNWFRCEYCIDRQAGMGKRDALRRIPWNARDRRAKRAQHDTVASDTFVRPHRRKTGSSATRPSINMRDKAKGKK